MAQLLGRILKFFIVIMVFVGFYQWWRPLPDQLLPRASEYEVPDTSVRFFADYTYLNKNGERKVEQTIWPRIFTLIENAEHYMLFDFSHFNDFQSRTPETTRALSRELAQKIVEKLATDKHIAVQFITDPVNTLYGGILSAPETALRRSGVIVIETDLNVLRDSNLLWSSLWRPFFSWWGNSTTGGWLPHPLQDGGSKVTLRTWASFLNFKANDRKVLVVDQSGAGTQKMVTLVSSGDPRDADSADGNVALEVRDSIWKDVVENERNIAEASGGSIVTYDTGRVKDDTGKVRVTALTETKIRDSVLRLLGEAKQGDKLQLAMPYLSDRKIIQALIDASNRGAIIRIILDPNKGLPGREAHGIPNRPVAKELMKGSLSGITIRWCETQVEQCNAKFFAGQTASSTFMMVGSANFTRRDINGFDLQTTILAWSSTPFTAWKDGQKYFDRLWENEGETFTSVYDIYKDETIWRSSVYRMMERTGLSTF